MFMAKVSFRFVEPRTVRFEALGANGAVVARKPS
jgi:hypothetical protein